MVKMAWDLEDWEFMAVDPTVLELFPCSRQDTVSWAQVTFLSVNPTICSQEGNTVYPLLLLHPTWDQKNLPAPQTVAAHSQKSVSPPARGLAQKLPGKTGFEFHFTSPVSKQPPGSPASSRASWALGWRQNSPGLQGQIHDIPGQAGSCASHRNGKGICVNKGLERQLPGTQTREGMSRRDWMCALANFP